jgi:hypothetical protein
MLGIGRVMIFGNGFFCQQRGNDFWSQVYISRLRDVILNVRKKLFLSEF